MLQRTEKQRPSYEVMSQQRKIIFSTVCYCSSRSTLFGYSWLLVAGTSFCHVCIAPRTIELKGCLGLMILFTHAQKETGNIRILLHNSSIGGNIYNTFLINLWNYFPPIKRSAVKAACRHCLLQTSAKILTGNAGKMSYIRIHINTV